MGFGCNAVGVTGCRIIDSPRERMIAMGSMDNVERSLEEHRLVVDAIVSRNPDEAARLMEQHVRNVQTRIEQIVFDSEAELE